MEKTASIPDFSFTLIQIIAYTFVALLVLGAVLFAVFYVIDKTQKQSTLRRNYPVIARFRYLFEHLGTFFRQYFFALDREELPFNRAERSWVYRAAKNVDTTVAFGSTRDLRPPGTVYFVNCAFPTMEVDSVEPSLVTIGPHVEHPYITSSLFNISGMSYGAISVPAIQALSAGAKKAGIWLNTGEGGLSSYHLDGGADIVFQIGTAKFGVRDLEGSLDDAKLRDIAAHEQVKMFELKLSQGAKPGKGGILPGVKVTDEIAAIRCIEAGKSAISPNRHPDVNSIEELITLINHIRNVTKKPVGFKQVVGDFSFFESLCEYLSKLDSDQAPDFITLDSADGGTGAAPMSLIDNMGMPIRESLPGVVDILEKYELKDRIKIIASGKLINPSEVAWAFCAGADFVVSARGFMFALGCIQSLQCNKNTCPTGVATHDKKLQYGLNPQNKAERVAAYAKNISKEVGIIAHSCGVNEPRQLKRRHARIVTENGRSMGLHELFPRV